MQLASGYQVNFFFQGNFAKSCFCICREHRGNHSSCLGLQTEITDVGAAALGKLVSRNSRLVHLALHGHHIQAVGDQPLAVAVEKS